MTQSKKERKPKRKSQEDQMRMIEKSARVVRDHGCGDGRKCQDCQAKIAEIEGEEMSDDAAEAWAELKAVFKDELARTLTPALEKMEAFSDRHPRLMPDNKFTKFLDRVYEVEARIWRWFWK